MRRQSRGRRIIPAISNIECPTREVSVRFMFSWLGFVLSTACALAAAAPDLTIEIKDYATFPITGDVDGKNNAMGLLARINFMREEPGPKKRFFVNDVNGQLYILDRGTKKLTTYLNFN